MAKESGNNLALGVIGGGVMAEAIVSCLIAQKVYAADSILVSEPQEKRREFWQQQYGVGVTDENLAVMNAETVLLAIKPQILESVVTALDLATHQELSPLIVSILAGVTLESLESAFAGCPVIRVMPNTPATVGAAMSAIALGTDVSSQQIQIATDIFAAVGEVVTVPESLIDGVTGLSGSGPAYVALMVEALADGGVAVGLPRAIAQKLAIQTLLGTAKLLQESGMHPAVLKDRVSSPGGTTIAGVAALEKGGFRAAVMEAVKASYQRSQELGK
ncbi:Pyrroline-5-carboxylate reductase [Hyella patelloides LEGE 07179]|uniref:Pyrroline-5-carboxylate reductase n=1 Tax=Hyella patelloides LEGE 07179 TaxID=945734 RepID=A0A563W038_9CYAN|nr:pyrroline-5-carboxylate reductase [Hyella patelloides]VEP17049.1 Pyrroline-5-carboxylate reductase [Hyella patelloides LEGE 07179]